MRQRIATLIALLLSLWMSAEAALAQPRQLTTLTLNQASPEQMASVLGNYLQPPSSVSHYQNRLVINATAAELAQIKGLLKQLDAQGRQLWLAVRVGEHGSHQQRQQSLQATQPVITQHGNGVITETRRQSTVSVRGFSGSNSGSRDGQQGLRATEGVAAFISTGVQVPVSSNNREQYQLHSVDSGFYATAWVNDDIVSVAIDQRNDRITSDSKHGQFSSQQLQSRVSGPLGQWIAIGVIAKSEQQQQRSTSYQHANRQGSDTLQGERIYLRVDLAD